MQEIAKKNHWTDFLRDIRERNFSNHVLNFVHFQ